MTARAARLWAKTAGGRPEDALKRHVMDLCRYLGLRCVHFRPARTKDGRWVTPVEGDGVGWPDLFILGPQGAMWRELKVPPNKLTPAQAAWIADLRSAGFDADVWWPVDWLSGRIRRELKALRKPRRHP